MSGIERQERWLYTGAAVVTEEAGILEDGLLLVEGDTIVWVGTAEAFRSSPYAAEPFTEIRADGGYWLPGFVDVHVHGGFGGDFMDAEASSYDRITSFHGRHGTTSMLATTVTAPKEDIDRVLEAAERKRHGSSTPGARLAGVHLEGPFISPKWPGAQNPAHIAPPRVDWLEEWHRRYPGLIRMVTLAPERENALEAVRWLTAHGILAAAGHTDATYAEMMAACDSGLRHAVHTFNAMKGVHHREPGTAGAVLADDRIRAEVIADGLHVHPAVFTMLARCKGPDGLVLITDAISAAGLGPGSYQLGGLDVTVTGDGAARLTEGGALAGSTLTMIEAFRFAVQQAGLSIAAASRAASGNPARAAGIDGRTGSLAAGKQADLLLVSPELMLRRVWIGGQELEL
ncbi:N-acetylglucosamine-6-phosphate deacetylase [Gorillibacterium sp. sgz5001074]|uniref:N-acetylglucosamine-6-phosphate deacetylase n=1 Tax=Gorillibacterium sp. sgz5001074 TaxID=3446695 RepID=UPI003F67996F